MLARRQNPLNILRRLDTLGKEEDLFSSMLDDLFHFHGFSPLSGISNPNFSPALNFVDKGDKYTLSVELPGMNKDETNIEIDDGTLVIKGEKKTEKEEKTNDRYVSERCYGSFRREVILPNDSVTEDISATYQNGVLSIDIPKVKATEKEKTKKIVNIE